MKRCIDLKEMFGRDYRIGRDPAFFTEYGAAARIPDPWYWRVLCQHGHIYPYGDEMLGAATNRRGAIANRLAAVAGVKITQDGDDGVNVVFPIECFAAVATILIARRRRRLSSAHRHALVAAGTTALARYRNSDALSRAEKGDPKPTADFRLAC